MQLKIFKHSLCKIFQAIFTAEKVYSISVVLLLNSRTNRLIQMRWPQGPTFSPPLTLQNRGHRTSWINLFSSKNISFRQWYNQVTENPLNLLEVFISINFIDKNCLYLQINRQFIVHWKGLLWLLLLSLAEEWDDNSQFPCPESQLSM